MALRESTDALARAESTEPSDPTEPIENAEAKDPTDPIESAEPTAPTESAEPTDPIDRNEPLEPTDRNEASDHSESPCTNASYRSRCEVNERQDSGANGEDPHPVSQGPRQIRSGQRLREAESLVVALPIAVAPIRHEGTERDQRQRHN